MIMVYPPIPSFFRTDICNFTTSTNNLPKFAAILNSKSVDNLNLQIIIRVRWYIGMPSACYDADLGLNPGKVRVANYADNDFADDIVARDQWS